MNTVVCV